MSDEMPPIARRDFLPSAGVTGLGVAMTNRLALGIPRASTSANDKIVVAVIGLNGRGQVHAQNFARLPNSEVGYLCDVDSAVLSKAQSAMTKQARAAKTVGDFRRALDDKGPSTLQPCFGRTFSSIRPFAWTPRALHTGRWA